MKFYNVFSKTIKLFKTFTCLFFNSNEYYDQFVSFNYEGQCHFYSSFLTKRGERRFVSFPLDYAHERTVIMLSNYNFNLNYES